MSALTQNIGTQAEGPENDTGGPVEGSSEGLSGLGRVMSEVQKIQTTHTALTRFYWTRKSLEQAMLNHMQNPATSVPFSVEVKFGHEVGRSDENKNRVHLVMTPSIPGTAVPWMEYEEEDFGITRFFGAPEKMSCPSWDLPAGAVQLGGTCVGAGAGQSTLSEATLNDFKPRVLRSLQLYTPKQEPGYPEDIEVANSICQSCYANANNFAYANNQFGMVLRYWWTATMLSTPQGRAAWIEIMVHALRAEVATGDWPLETHSASPNVPLTDCASGGISFRPFRLHSSGDFFSPTYMDAWFDVMRDPRVQALKILFWAPTRSWVMDGFQRRVAERHEKGTFPDNLTLRPSGYHFGDSAPRLPEPWAAGTTSLYAIREEKQVVTFEERGEGKKPKKVTKTETILTAPPADHRRNWDCQTYAVVDQKHTCPMAQGSNGEPSKADGGVGCRTCWVYKGVSVQYSAHA